MQECRHCSEHSPPHTIMRSPVRIPCQQSVYIVKFCTRYIHHRGVEKRTKVNKKRPDLAHILVSLLCSIYNCWRNNNSLSKRSDETLQQQCDQVARLFFNICPLSLMKICPKASTICQSMFYNFPNAKRRFQKLPKIFKIWSKWQISAKSGHTIQQLVQKIGNYFKSKSIQIFSHHFLQNCAHEHLLLRGLTSS